MTVLLLFVQVPVVVERRRVGVRGAGVAAAVAGPTASELPVKVRLAADEIVIDVLLTLLTVAPLGMPCPYMYIPG